MAAHKDNWKEYLLDQQAKEYSQLILENHEHLDEGVMDIIKGGGKAVSRMVFPFLAINDLANMIEKSPLASEIAHFTLDAAGFIPGYGEIADGLNAAWYIKKREWFNAAMSLISLLPVAGDIIGKGAKWLGKGSKGFAKFIGKYGDDIAKIWKKATGNTKKLKGQFQKLVDFVGGEEKFDEAIGEMGKKIEEMLTLSDKAKEQAKNTAEKVENSPELREKIAQKVAAKQQAQVALQELQTEYSGIVVPDEANQYTGYASSIDNSGPSSKGGGGALEETAIRQGRRDWKKVVAEDARQRKMLTEAAQKKKG